MSKKRKGRVGFNAVVAHNLQVMSAIDWLPKRNGCVGVAAVKNVNFDERVQLSGQARTYSCSCTNDCLATTDAADPAPDHMSKGSTYAPASPGRSFTLRAFKLYPPTEHFSNEIHRANHHTILQVDNAYVLLWDFADLIHPMLKLESPHEIFCFRFNPSIPGVSSETSNRL